MAERIVVVGHSAVTCLGRDMDATWAGLVAAPAGVSAVILSPIAARVMAGEAPTLPIPDFNDAYQTQRVLEAAMIAASEGHPVKLDQVK